MQGAVLKSYRAVFDYIYKKYHMKQVSFQSIEKAILRVDNLDDDQLEQISEQYGRAQQPLLGYVLSAAEEYENEKLEGLIIYYFCLLSACFEEEKIVLNQVSDEEIDAFQEPYFEMLDAYFENNEEDILEDFCDEPELSRFMAVEVSTEDADGSALDDETATQLFIVAIAMISLMHRAQRS